jgi:hypothetical protein
MTPGLLMKPGRAFEEHPESDIGRVLAMAAEAIARAVEFALHASMPKRDRTSPQRCIVITTA